MEEGQQGGMNYDSDIDADEQCYWSNVSNKNVDSDVAFTSEDELSHSSASEPESISTDVEWKSLVLE